MLKKKNSENKGRKLNRRKVSVACRTKVSIKVSSG